MVDASLAAKVRPGHCEKRDAELEKLLEDQLLHEKHCVEIFAKLRWILLNENDVEKPPVIVPELEERELGFGMAKMKMLGAGGTSGGEEVKW